MSGRHTQSGITMVEARVRNYRSLRTVDVSFDSLTVLIGENNAGKTSLLEALFSAIGAGRRTLSEDDIFLNSKEPKPPKERYIIIDILFKPINDKDEVIDSFPAGSYWLELWGNGVAQDTDDNDFVAIRTTLRWNAVKGEYVTERRFLNEWVASENIEIAKVNEKAGIVSNVQVEPISLYFMDAKRDIQDELQNRNSFWHKLVSDPGLSDQQIEDIEKSLSDLNNSIIENSEILTHVQSHLNDLYQTVSSEKGNVNITPLARHLRDLSRGMDISFSTKDAQSFPLVRHGMGTRSLAAVLTFRAYTEWRQDHLGTETLHPMLALEEPEAHLHPQAQRALYTQIEAIPGQRIISTHSPYIASQALIKQFRHFKKVGTETKVTQIDTSSLDSEDLRKINRMVMNTRGEILFARALVFFEGETEEQALPIFAKAYWGEHVNTLGISMIGIGGKGNYFPFIRMAESFDIPWFIFSDGEDEAIKSVAKALEKINRPKILQDNDNVFVIPNQHDFEAYLLSLNDYDDLLIDCIVEKKATNEQHKAGLINSWQNKTDKKKAIEEELSRNKTQYAPPVAHAITQLEGEKRFPPLVRVLLDRMSKEPGLAKPKEAIT